MPGAQVKCWRRPVPSIGVGFEWILKGQPSAAGAIAAQGELDAGHQK